ncbi:hypothetical protein [Azospirillum sp. B510]|uniref:hypothetical protein n=1 Tax=Azospirillum sp. (strain B510) TaxID=137722 RepID=UPI00031A675A|nr:hypothetical protein [Azospirillum sp. B510]
MSDTGMTFLAFGIPALVVTLFVVATLLMVRNRGWGRLYWAFCALLIGFGSAGVAGSLCCFPPLELPDGTISGEMPPTFGAGLMVTAMGCGATLLGLFGLAYRSRLRGRRGVGAG